jgi:hypothetical protein
MSVSGSNRAGTVAMGIVLVLAVCTFGGCSRSKDAFEGVNQAVADVNPGALGTVAVDRSFGSGGTLGQPPTRRVVVISSGSAGSAIANAAAALRAAGLNKTGATGWQRTKDGQFVVVFVTTQGAGSRVEGWDGVVGEGQTALVLTFTRST